MLMQQRLLILPYWKPCANRFVALRQSRPFTLSSSRRNIRFPHGVPAFPISPKLHAVPRELPAYNDVRPKTVRNIVIFLSICGAWTIAGILAINYERFASPVTASTLHEVRKSPQATALLGRDIQHRSMHPAYKGWYRYDGWFRQPWVSGSIQLTKGKIDIAYDVKGSSIHLPLTDLANFQRVKDECILSAQGLTNFQSGRL